MSKAEELSKLFELKKQGVLSEDEFNHEKAKLLAADALPAASGGVRSLSAAAITPGHVDSASNFASCSMIQMACPKCKGEVQFLPGLEVIRCTFCGNEVSVERREPKTFQIPDLLIPFAVGRKEAESRCFNRLADDDFVPDDVFDDKKAITVFGIFCPAYLFNGKYEGNWTALSIVKYTVKRGDKSHTEEQANPISGQVRGLLNYVAVASEAASAVAVDANDLRAKLKPYQPEFVQGFLVESLSSCESQEACEVDLRSHARALAEAEAVKMMPTSDYRNLAVNVDVTAKATAFLQPLWGCEIKHSGKVYRMWLPGHGVAEPFSGEMPQDANRKNLAEKLKRAGNALFVVGALLCCGVGGWIFFSGSDSTEKDFLLGMDRGTSGIVIGLIIAIPFVIMGFRKSQAAQAHLAKILKESKTRRRNNKPRV
jgi:hypothetical protein